MEVKLFKIMGIFSYVAAFLALLTAVGLAVMSAMSFIGHVDETIKQPKLETFLQEKKGEQLQKRSDEMITEPSLEDFQNEEDEAFKNKRTRLLNRIVSALNRYASLVGDVSAGSEVLVDPEIFEERILDGVVTGHRGFLYDEEYLKFLSGLAEESEKLESKGEEIRRLHQDDPGRVDWYDFIEWYCSSYRDQWSEQLEQIATKQEEQAEGRRRALILLAAAGPAFVVFILFTMILLFVKVEENTREIARSFRAKSS